MPHGSVQYHLYTIIYNERPFLGSYSLKNEIKGNFGPKRGIYRHHTSSIIALLPLRELDMSHGSVQYHLYTIIYNERPFLGSYSLKNEINGHFGPKRGIYRHHTSSIIALLPLRELDMSHGSVQYHLYTIIYNERPFLGSYSLKNEIRGHFGPKRGIYRHHTCSIIALLPLRELDMSHGSVQYHLYTIIYNERPFLGSYSLKNEIRGHFGPKRGIYRPYTCSNNSIITFT